MELREDKCHEINKLFGITNQLQAPDIDLTDWKSIFESLKAMDRFIIIEDELTEHFAIGVIEQTFKSKLYFKSFDADGVWDETGWKIPYSCITTVKWGNRYANTWQRYLENDPPLTEQNH